MIGGPLVAVALVIGLVGARAEIARAGDSIDFPTHDSALAESLFAQELLSALVEEEDPFCASPVQGEVVLDRDVTCGTVDLDDGAVLDLGGFALDAGQINGDGAMTIRNGTLRLTGSRQYLGTDTVLEDLVVPGVSLDPSFTIGQGRLRITRCRFSGSSLTLYYGGSSSLIEDSVFENNWRGISIQKPSFVTITGNVFRNNGVGVSLYNEGDESGVNWNTVSDNAFEDNDYGVYVPAKYHCYAFGANTCLEGNQIVGNLFVANRRSGVVFDTTGCRQANGCNMGNVSLSIEDNVFEGNGFEPATMGYPGPDDPALDDGITVRGAPTEVDGITIAGNVAASNRDLGIAAPDATDGGGNRASGNGNALECVGVACMPTGPCADGVDNDGDGFVDFQPTGGDPGCEGPLWSSERPQCQDGVDNDRQPGIDFDGGASLHGGIPIADPDPHCVGQPWRNSEVPGCGLGAELSLMLPLLGLAASRRRRRPTRALPRCSLVTRSVGLGGVGGPPT